MEVLYRDEDDTYYTRCKVGNQTIELGINYYDENLHDRKSYWNIYLTIFNKRKDMYSNMDKKAITGKDPIATFLTARKMFEEVETVVIKEELINGNYDEIAIFATWVDNRRRDAYYKVLHKMGYDWGTVDREKCIIKTFKKGDIKPEALEDEY